MTADTLKDTRTAPSLAAGAAVGLVRAYQKTLSPVLPVVLGPGSGCRFYPSCSEYAAQAIATHGLLAGSCMSARRLLKCTPFHPGGNDPVPPPSR